MIEEANTDATVLAIFYVRGFFDFEKSPFYIVKITIFTNVVWVRNFEMIDFHVKIPSNKKIKPISSVSLAELIDIYNN